MFLRVVLSLAVFACLLSREQALAQSQRLAVMDFTDAAPKGSLGHLGKGLQSMITTDLAAAATFELVERARLQDIQAELKLQQGREIDAKTAVQVGKLAGASHLITGSYTVLDQKMRIDCRLVSVESGKVMLAEKVEGEKGGFFELEKLLVQKVVSSLGTKVEAKQRAQMAKVHTADFEAFRLFSDGIAGFDAKQYDVALSAMRGATEVDAEFKLAAVTLAGYEQLVRKARASADAAKLAEGELSRLADDKEAQAAQAIVAKLVGLAKQGPALDRGVALQLLLNVYGSPLRLDDLFQLLWQRSDKFARDRAYEGFRAAYFQTAMEAFPALPFQTLYLVAPTSLATFDVAFANARKLVVEYVQKHFFKNRLSSWDTEAVDTVQRINDSERMYQLALKLNPPLAWKTQAQLELAERYRFLADLDRSTAYLVQVQKGTKDARALENVADMLERNRDLARLLSESDPRVARFAVSRFERVQIGRTRDDGDSALLRTLEELRTDATFGFLIGDEPFLSLGQRARVYTGPRSSPARAHELRLWAAQLSPFEARKNPRAPMLVALRAPTSQFKLTFSVAYDIPEDLHIVHAIEPNAQQPQLSVLFGLRNCGSDPTGYAVSIDAEGVRLQRLSAKAMEEWEVLASWAAKLEGIKKVALALVGSTLTVQVDGQSWSTKVPTDGKPGYLGFAYERGGYAALRELQIQRN
jgi:TolB-like protein